MAVAEVRAVISAGWWERGVGSVLSLARRSTDGEVLTKQQVGAL